MVTDFVNGKNRLQPREFVSKNKGGVWKWVLVPWSYPAKFENERNHEWTKVSIHIEIVPYQETVSTNGPVSAW